MCLGLYISAPEIKFGGQLYQYDIFSNLKYGAHIK
jgi:hypothetical protein